MMSLIFLGNLFSNALETESAKMSLIFWGNLFSNALETDTGYRNKNHAKPAAEIVNTARLILCAELINFEVFMLCVLCVPTLICSVSCALGLVHMEPSQPGKRAGPASGEKIFACSYGKHCPNNRDVFMWSRTRSKSKI